MQANDTVNHGQKKKQRKNWIWWIVGIAFLVCLFFYVFMNKGSSLTSASNSGYAMGAQIVTTVYHSDSDTAQDVSGNILDKISELDSLINWRLTNSQAAQINENAGSTWATAPEVADIIKEMVYLSDDTNGRFDLTIAPISNLWDIDRANPHVPTAEEIQKLLAYVNYQNIQLKEDSVLLGKNQQIDLGSVGKGLACDWAVEVLQGTDAQGAIVSVGGSIGIYGQKPDLSPWKVEIQDPNDHNAIIGTLHIENTGFISTSGDYEKFFTEGGQKYHHILDALTGYPADSNLTSVTILSDSGMYSDALSTACFIVGLEESIPLLEKYGAEGIFVDNLRNIYCTSGLFNLFEQTMDSEYTIHELQ